MFCITETDNCLSAPGKFCFPNFFPKRNPKRLFTLQVRWLREQKKPLQRETCFRVGAEVRNAVRLFLSVLIFCCEPSLKHKHERHSLQLLFGFHDADCLCYSSKHHENDNKAINLVIKFLLVFEKALQDDSWAERKMLWEPTFSVLEDVAQSLLFSRNLPHWL